MIQCNRGVPSKKNFETLIKLCGGNINSENKTEGVNIDSLRSFARIYQGKTIAEENLKNFETLIKLCGGNINSENKTESVNIALLVAVSLKLSKKKDLISDPISDPTKLIAQQIQGHGSIESGVINFSESITAELLMSVFEISQNMGPEIRRLILAGKKNTVLGCDDDDINPIESDESGVKEERNTVLHDENQVSASSASGPYFPSAPGSPSSAPGSVLTGASAIELAEVDPLAVELLLNLRNCGRI